MTIAKYEVEIAAFNPDDLPEQSVVEAAIREAVLGLDSGINSAVSADYAGEYTIKHANAKPAESKTPKSEK